MVGKLTCHAMEARQGTECLDWYKNRRPVSKLTPTIHLNVGGLLLTGDKEQLAGKSNKLAKLLKKSHHEDLSVHLADIPADQETLDLVSRFCHGFDIKLSATNVIRVATVALFLGMTESHCANNLFQKAEVFFEEHILPSWNESVKALKSAESFLQQALETGLVDQCVESLIAKVIDDPCLLGEPLRTCVPDEDADHDENENVYMPNARRKLFDDIDWKWEDLNLFSLRIYAPVMNEMIRRQVPQEYVAANVSQYAKMWLFKKEGDSSCIYTKNSSRELVEALEQLLPHQKGSVTSTFLFEMLKYAISLDANTECRDGLEVRIGMQLDCVSVADLLIPMQEYAKDERYDTECIRRILKHFYENYSGSDVSGLYAVAELIEELLAEISTDIDLKMRTFIALADMSVSASNGLQRDSDGLYTALDVYLDKHRHLTESEKDELCGMLDCNKLSMEAREHAALNQRLPLRTVIQILFLRQLRLSSEFGEIEKMGNKVLELERECDDMKREIQKGGDEVAKKEKRSIWKEVKRKFACVRSLHDRDCHVKRKKKVHPR